VRFEFTHHIGQVYSTYEFEGEPQEIAELFEKVSPKKKDKEPETVAKINKPIFSESFKNALDQFNKELDKTFKNL